MIKSLALRLGVDHTAAQEFLVYFEERAPHSVATKTLRHRLCTCPAPRCQKEEMPPLTSLGSLSVKLLSKANVETSSEPVRVVLMAPVRGRRHRARRAPDGRCLQPTESDDRRNAPHSASCVQVRVSVSGYTDDRERSSCGVGSWRPPRPVQEGRAEGHGCHEDRPRAESD